MIRNKDGEIILVNKMFEDEYSEWKDIILYKEFHTVMFDKKFATLDSSVLKLKEK